MLQGMDKNKKQLLESVDSILFEHLAFVSLDHWFIFKVCSKPVMDILWSTCNSSWWHKWAPTVITTTEKNIKYQKLWYLKPIIPLAQHQHSVWLTHIGYARTIPFGGGAIYCLSLKHSYEGNENIIFLYMYNIQISVVLLFAFDQKLLYLYLYYTT